jgi:D-3-phosphoglycerate dehydrogenase / 2-oxoglutarate reductase
MKIALLDDYQDRVRHLPCFSLLEGMDVKVFNHSAKGLGQLAIRLADVEALVLIRERTAISRALIEKLPKLKFIAQTGRIGAHVDLAAAAAHGITVVEGSGDPVAPAELTWALILAARRKIPQYASLLKQGLWQASAIEPARSTLGCALHGRVMGIWGYGRIGQRIARYAQSFGMTVLVWGSEASRNQAVTDGFGAANSKKALFVQSDVLSLHLRLSDATRHGVEYEDLSLMKPDALIVNTSRAELIAPGALEAALREGRPGGAALDVFEIEPLPINASILQLDNVLATPHIGFVETDSYERYFRPAFEAIVDFVQGKPVNNIAQTK